MTLPSPFGTHDRATCRLDLEPRGARGTRGFLPSCAGYGSLQDELLLVETSQPDGSKAQILYRNGGLVVAADLEKLCIKVTEEVTAKHFVKVYS